MRKSFVTYSLGILLQILACILIIPACIAFFDVSSRAFPAILFDHRLCGFIIAIVSSLVCGSILRAIGSKTLTGNGVREGFVIVTFGWLLLTLFGALPLFVYFISQVEVVTAATVFRAATDAYFEIMSGFTTTGATIITDIEILPRGILFWRSLTHWLGGMGIVTLALALWPAFGIASYQMFRGEVPGPTAEQLKPRLAQTATILWGIYGLLTAAETILLMCGGMSLFDALCHAFGTMATGGFSTRNASIAAFNSAYIDWVVIIFMFFAGMNFIIHYRIFFTRKFDLVRNNREFHFYVAVLLLSICLTAVVLRTNGVVSAEAEAKSFRNKPLSTEQLQEKVITESAKVNSVGKTLRYSAFQVVSLTTTTGFCTADFDVWPNGIRYLLVILMFFGGCAGSTGGGIKMMRVMVVMKTAWREVITMIKPRIIVPLKIAGQTIGEKLVANIGGFVALFLLSFVFFVGLMSFLIDDYTTAITSVVATMCNIGPGLSGVGATENYAWIPLPGKWILTLCMLLGRLEIYTVFIAFAPVSWRR
ncbi:TrkH family potassium uptake protein [Candidatus Omnitrophota bacterium]